MKCPMCNGVGYKKISAISCAICERCGGMGEIVQTNEEWFCQLSTAKKAKTIKMVINTCVSCKEHGTVRTRGCLLRQNMAKGLLFLPCMDEDGIVKWLKQPHKEIGE